MDPAFLRKVVNDANAWPRVEAAPRAPARSTWVAGLASWLSRNRRVHAAETSHHV
jgi:hypothetical protein